MDSEWCFVLAYHHQRLSCSLGRNPCAIAEPHKHYTTMVLRNNVEQECLIWNQWDGSSDFPRIARSNHNFRSVARKVQQTSSYIGIMNAVLPGNGKAYFAINGRETELSDAEMLRVHPYCSLAWVPYTVGQPFPKRAVITGSNIGSHATYSIRMGSFSAETFGFYIEGDPVGHYSHYGCHEALEFDVLIRVKSALGKREQDCEPDSISRDRPIVLHHLCLVQFDMKIFEFCPRFKIYNLIT